MDRDPRYQEVGRLDDIFKLDSSEAAQIFYESKRPDPVMDFYVLQQVTLFSHLLFDSLTFSDTD